MTALGALADIGTLIIGLGIPLGMLWSYYQRKRFRDSVLWQQLETVEEEKAQGHRFI